MFLQISRHIKIWKKKKSYVIRLFDCKIIASIFQSYYFSFHYVSNDRGKVKYELRVASNKFEFTNYELKFTSYEFKSTSYEFKSTSYEFESASCNIKIAIWSNKTTSYIVNIRVKRGNSEFKMLDFKSYKKCYFYCLANAELKPHTKVLKNLFPIMFLKKHIWPLYYHHILAAGKVRLYYDNTINMR